MSTTKPDTRPAQQATQGQNVVKPKRDASPTAKLKYPFWFGGSAASMAAVVTHPLDLVKVRLQTRTPEAPKTMISTFGFIIRNEGFQGIYAGLSAALLRQLTYSTVRFGVYEDLKTRFTPAPNPLQPQKKPTPSLLTLIWTSSLSGFIGGVVGNPGDVLNVRMQGDMSRPVDQRRNYKNAIHGLYRMVKDEGISSIFRGIGANSSRALLMNASQLASYDIFKNMFVANFHFKDNIYTHFVSSLCAGFVATTICSPVDVIKTRVMSAGGKMPLLEILAKAQKTEGWLWCFKGWVPSFIRLGPQTICTMIFFEQHKKLYRSWKGVDEGHT